MRKFQYKENSHVLRKNKIRVRRHTGNWKHSLVCYPGLSSTYHPRVICGNSKNSRRNRVFSTFLHTSRWGVDNTCSRPI